MRRLAIIYEVENTTAAFNLASRDNECIQFNVTPRYVELLMLADAPFDLSVFFRLQGVDRIGHANVCYQK